MQPRTRRALFEPEVVERVLSVMTTCGMYDAAGEWVVDVGLPAKSGVGGGVLAVLPGQIGIALYSPRLDRHGNSVRGVAACRQISRELELHFLHVASDRRSAIRDAWDVGTAPSSRRRTPDEQEVLNEYGACARVYALHGDLLFAGAESVVRELTERAPELEVIVLDISRVAEIAARRAHDARRHPGRAGGARLPARARRPRRRARRRGGDRGLRRPRRGDRVGRGPADRAPRRHARHDRADPARRARPGGRPAPRRARRAAPAARAPQRRRGRADRRPPATSRPGIFFIVSGQATADVTDDEGTVHRVAVLPAGTSFGKRAVISGEPHATDVRADTDLDLFVLTPAAMRELERRSPRTAIALLRTMFTQQRAAPEPRPPRRRRSAS